MKRIYTLLFCGLFIFVGIFAGSPNTADAAVHDAHWAEPYLNNLVEQEIMRGDENGDLNPDDYITRAEFVAMMNRAFKYTNKGKINFKDVDETNWYYDDISIAKTQGYFNGIETNEAGPEIPLRREEAVTLLCRALKIEGVEEDNMQFVDSREFSAYSKAYINAAVEKEFLTGYDDSTFRAWNYMTRGEMAKLLSEVAGEIVKEEGSNYIGYANGNVSIVQTGSTLKSTIIPGDLYITAGMGTGYTRLKDVVVNGDLIVSGTGNAESGQVSVILEDCDINHLIINSNSSEIMSVRAEGGSVIEKTTVRSSTYLEEANSSSIAFQDVILDGESGTTLSLSGSFENVKVKGENNKLSLDKGTIEGLTIDEDAVKGSVFIEKNAIVYALYCDTATTVTGTGDVDSIVINANGCNISMLPDHIYIRPGVTAIIAGKTMTYLDGEANNADPAFLDGYPRYMDLQAKSVKLLAKVNKPGKLYWAVKNVDLVNAGMSEDDVMNPDSRYVVKSGSVSMIGDKEVTINVTGLQSGVNYEYYMVFEDFKEATTAVEGEGFTTVDIVAPKFLNSTPKILSSSKDSFTVTVMPSKDVTLYWAVLPNKAISPTAESLSELKVSGALGKGEVTGVEMNDSRDIIVRGVEGESELTELTKYDIYMVLKDASGNLSKLYKVMGTTGDDTPPEFMEGYPWAEPSLATSLKIRHMETEAGTLYWAVYDFDADFPPVDDPDAYKVLTPAEQEQLKIRAVTTGQKAVKSGKTTVKEKTDALLTISGLAKSTPYDVYFIIMDKSGNYSEVASLKGLKTLDKTAPVAKMAFDKLVDGNPMITSNIMIEFDEIAYYDGTGDDKDLRLVFLEEAKGNNWDADTTLSASDVKLIKNLGGRSAILKSMFTLHDLQSIDKLNDEVAIDFDKVKISEEKGKTIITFPPDCFKGGIGLESGGKYQFELNNVTDSEQNAMNQKTRLDIFKLVAPTIYITDYMGTEVLSDYQIGFTLIPTKDISNTKLFDVIAKSNRAIGFNLKVVAEKDEEDGTVSKIEKNYTSKTSEGAYQIVANQAVSLGKAKENYIVFENLTKDMSDGKIYGDRIHLIFDVVSLEGVYNRNSWHGAMTLECMGVVGGTTQNKSDIRNLGINLSNNEPANKKVDAFEYIKGLDEILVVTNPESYSAKRVYTDTAQPEPVVLRFDTFDTAAKANIALEKAGKFYYVVLPSKTTTADAGSSDYDGKYADPTKGQVLEGKPSYGTESKSGMINITEGYTQVEELLENLQPDTTYRMFYVVVYNELVAEAEMRYVDFTTDPEAVPVLIQGGQLMPNGLLTEKSAGMQATANTEVVVRWIMQPAATAPAKTTANKGWSLGSEDKSGSPYSPDQIFSLSDKNNDITDYGTFEVFMDEDSEYSFDFECKNMNHTQLYNVYLAMKTKYSGKMSEYVYMYEGIRAQDTEPPEIVKCDTTARLKASKSITVGGIQMVQNVYSGSVIVEFSEPLYRSNSASAGKPDPLLAGDLFNADGTINDSKGIFDIGSDIATISKGVAYTATDDDTSVSVVNGFKFNFEDMTPDATVAITGYIYDKGVRIAGTFKMTFKEEIVKDSNGIYQATGRFEAEFVPVTAK